MEGANEMSDLKANSIQSNAPLVLALAPSPDRFGYHETVRIAEQIAASYDPETQTSNIPEYAGTNPTVCHSGTGYLPFPDSDYPTDDA